MVDRVTTIEEVEWNAGFSFQLADVRLAVESGNPEANALVVALRLFLIDPMD